MRLSRRNLLLVLLEVGATALIVFGLWRFSQTNQSFAVATFSDIWREFKDAFLFDRVGRDVVPTVRRIGIAYALAIAIGSVLGLAIGSSRLVQLFGGPLFAFVRAVPPVALVPPAIILIGVEDNMKIFLTVFVAIWPIALNTADGVRELDQTMLDTSRTFRIPRLDRLRYVTIPAVAPRTFAGMHTALALTVIAVIATEYLVGTEGIGFILQQSQATFLIGQMWAGILLLGILGNLLNIGFLAARRRALYWETPDAAEPQMTF